MLSKHMESIVLLQVTPELSRAYLGDTEHTAKVEKNQQLH